MSRFWLFLQFAFYWSLAKPKAAYRFITYRALSAVAPSRLIEQFYDKSTAGYSGWVRAGRFGLLAFRRDDGTLQFSW